MQHKREDDFVERIAGNAHRYLKLFCEAIDKALPPADVDLDEEQRRDVWDVLQMHRAQQHEQVTIYLYVGST